MVCFAENERNVEKMFFYTENAIKHFHPLFLWFQWIRKNFKNDRLCLRKKIHLNERRERREALLILDTSKVRNEQT